MCAYAGGLQGGGKAGGGSRVNQREIQWSMGNGGGWGMGVRRVCTYSCMLCILYQLCGRHQSGYGRVA